MHLSLNRSRCYTGAHRKCPPVFADMGGLHGTENRLGLPDTENQDPYRSRRISAPGTRITEAKYTRNSDAEDPVTGRMMAAKNAAGDTAMTTRHTTGDTTKLEGEDTFTMKIHQALKIRAGEATGHVAIDTETVTGTTPPTRKATILSRTRSVVGRADTARLPQGTTTDRPW